MELERLSLILRQRNPWEAIDLGFAMVREWWREVYAPWLAVFAALSAGACLALPPNWALLLVWWLKPALDRIVLFVLARTVFNARPSLRQTLRQFPSYARNGLGWYLSLYRLSPIRSFSLPIRQLENAHGATARSRSRQLRRRVSNQAVWLTVICLHFEVVVFLSLVLLYDLLVPASRQEFFDVFTLLNGPQTSARGYLVTGVYLLAMALIEPLYVAGGFALYLNRRTALEGWDLEVQLRRMAPPAPHTTGAKRPVAWVISALLAIGTAGMLVSGSFGWAQDAPLTHSRAEREIKEILEQPQFQQYEDQLRIVPLNKIERIKQPNMGWLASFLTAVAEILRGLAWVAMAVVLLCALYWGFRRWQGARTPERSRWAPPDTLFGLDVRPQALPADVAVAAQQLAQAGDLVGALSLLYRGALTTLLHRDHIELTSGDTEADCLLKTRTRIADPAYLYLARLLGAWQGAAYAHRMPSQPEVVRLATDWPGFFRADA